MILHTNMIFRKITTKVLLIFFSSLLFSCRENPESNNLNQSNNITHSIIATDSSISIKQNQKHDGEWKFEKNGILGGFEEGKSYFYSKSQLDTLHQNIEIILTGSNISFKSICSSKLIIIKENLGTFLSGKLSENKTIEDVKNDFKDNINIVLDDSIIIYELECAHPYNKLIVASNKLILLEYGAFYTVFSKNISSDSVITKTNNCRNVQVEMGSGEICTFDNTTVNDVYRHFISSAILPYINHLEQTIPLNDKVINIGNNGLISIDYNWKSKIKLIITLLFDGGTTEIHFEQKNNNVERSIYNFAD